MKHALFIFFGVVCVTLGAIGIVTPVLPTTPFLLLAAWLFSKSSNRLHNLLLGNKVFGKYITNYFENKPIALKARLVSIAFLWLGLGLSFYFGTLSTAITILLVVVGILVSLHIFLLGKFRKDRKGTSDTKKIE
ncbi:MAG: YbaN family protein [Bacteroidales bacterium]|jgi:uncharacterized membrane protein YbaN (DUF454 family)|nr:YbaN family protein [Bacteroidales bacterium]